MLIVVAKHLHFAFCFLFGRVELSLHPSSETLPATPTVLSTSLSEGPTTASGAHEERDRWSAILCVIVSFTTSVISSVMKKEREKWDEYCGTEGGTQRRLHDGETLTLSIVVYFVFVVVVSGPFNVINNSRHSFAGFPLMICGER